MTLFRWIVGLPAAAMITAGLFFMMSEMIKNKVVDTSDPKPSIKLKITADPPEPGGETDFPKPPKPPEDIPETIIDFPRPTGTPGGVPVDTGPGEIGPTTPAEGRSLGGYSIIIAPPYPEGCRSKGAEGVVVVKFDITPQGDVTNIQIVESPDRCFNRPIRNAVAKWKYAPASNNGRAVARRGVTETFNFQLVD